MSSVKSVDSLFLGVDVGTGSVRAGLFTATGERRGMGVEPIAMHRPRAGFVEQSSRDIWRACGVAVRGAMREAGAGPGQVGGIGFDATCSLVAAGAGGEPVTVSPAGGDEWDVIVWMDHRAAGQAERINARGHPVLRHVGGVISPEMQSPKLLWLKEELPASWARAAKFFDLPDYLVWRATGEDVRSLCTTVCKWTYLGHEPAMNPGSAGRWDESYFRAAGLGDLADEQWRRIGTRVRPMGEPVGRGLTAVAAEGLGLAPGTPVGVAIIDAHAGGLGVLGAVIDGEAAAAETLEERLALIGGTSSCHMACSRAPLFIGGIWGPYFSAMIPGMWLTEGGQSATGALIDHVIFSHARGAELRDEARERGVTVYDLLNARLAAMSDGLAVPGMLTRDLHVLPDFHGNRSPRADPSLRGVISGLGLDDSADALALLYLATVQGVAHGTRHIIDTMNAGGHRIRTVLACGGGTKNPVFVREHADATGCRLVLPREPEAVLLGSAVLGAVAAGAFDSIPAAMAVMNAAGAVIEPQGGETARFHAAKHRAFQQMHADWKNLRELMRG